MANYIGNKFTQQDSDKLVGAEEGREAGRAFGAARRPAPGCWSSPPARPHWTALPFHPRPCHLVLQREFEKRADPNDRNAQALLEEMRQHVKKASGVPARRAARQEAQPLRTHFRRARPPATAAAVPSLPAARGDAQERGPPPLLLHPGVPRGSAAVH